MKSFFCRFWRPLVVIFLLNFLVVTPALALKPDDPDYFLQWYIDKLGLPEAWDYTTGSPEVTIAVLDTGVDIDHPDLVDNIWTNKDEVPNDGIDNDHNGYIDDVHGYDFVEGNPNPKPDFSLRYNPLDVTHGTLVAGLLGATGNNLTGIVGINWRVKIMPLRVLDSYGTANVEPTIKAIDYAIKNGADVINLSFQGDASSPEFQQALEQAYKAGIVVVVAAGNGSSSSTASNLNLDLTPIYPVCYTTSAGGKMLLGVGSSNARDEYSYFSNFGKKCVDVAAPGEDIYSTQLYRGEQTDLDVYYGGGWNGTSFSAPLVAGTAALIKSINKNFSPDLIHKFIVDNTDPIKPFLAVNGQTYSFGRLNVARAIKAAVDYNAANREPVFQAKIVHDFYLLTGIVAAPAGGQKPEIKIFHSQLAEANKFLAYDESFLGGVNLAVGDINKDGKDEIVTGPGAGSIPQVKVFNQGGDVLAQFSAYDDKFKGGIKVAMGDVDGDGQEEIITVPQAGGGPHVRVFDLNGKVKYQFMAEKNNFSGGLNLVVSDLDLDGLAEIITAPLKNGAPEVRISNYQGKVLKKFLAYDKKFSGGISLAAADINNDYSKEIITAPLSGLGPEVRIFFAAGELKSHFLAEYEKFMGGNNLAVGDYDLDGAVEILAARASGDPEVRIFDVKGQEKAQFLPFSQDYQQGINIGIIN